MDQTTALVQEIAQSLPVVLHDVLLQYLVSSCCSSVPSGTLRFKWNITPTMPVYLNMRLAVDSRYLFAAVDRNVHVLDKRKGSTVCVHRDINSSSLYVDENYLYTLSDDFELLCLRKAEANSIVWRWPLSKLRNASRNVWSSLCVSSQYIYITCWYNHSLWMVRISDGQLVRHELFDPDMSPLPYTMFRVGSLLWIYSSKSFIKDDVIHYVFPIDDPSFELGHLDQVPRTEMDPIMAVHGHHMLTYHGRTASPLGIWELQQVTDQPSHPKFSHMYDLHASPSIPNAFALDEDSTWCLTRVRSGSDDIEVSNYVR